MFDIVVSAKGQDVRVQGHVDGMWTDEHSLGPEFTLDALDEFANSVERAARYDKPIESALLVKAHGLYRAMFQLDVLDKLTRASERTPGQIVLRLIIEEHRLQKVPWEALCKPKTHEDFLAKGTSMQVIRGVISTEPVSPCRVDAALRILVIGRELSSSTFTAMKYVTQSSPAVEWLPPLIGSDVTWERVLRHIRVTSVRPHVVHFIGHGSVRQTDASALDKPGKPVLGLENNQDDENTWITAEAFAGELTAHWGDDLRLLVLETCSGGEPGTFGSAAETFIRSGIHAVFSSLWSIRAEKAFDASQTLYESLTRSPTTRGNLIASVSTARRSQLVHGAAGFSFVLHMRSVSPTLFDFSTTESTTPAPDKSMKKEKPNVLAGNKRKTPLSSAPPPPPAIAAPGSHTSIVIDRIKQWQPILDHCASSQTHLVFIVHGTREQSMSNFIKRIKEFLPEDLHNKKPNAQTHRPVLVEGKPEQIAARTADEWKRVLIAATQLKSGEFDTVLPRETRTSSPVYVFVHGGGPLQLDAVNVKGIIGLFRGLLDPVVGLLESKDQLTHPIRFVLPVEHRHAGGDPALKDLKDGLEGMKTLLLEPLTEVTFPPWDEVWEYVTTECKGSEKDASFLTRCKAKYDKVAQSPKRTVQALGDALHIELVAWEEVDARRKR